MDPNPDVTPSKQAIIDKVSPQTLSSITKRRRTVGYLLGISSVAGFIFLAGLTYNHLAALAETKEIERVFAQFCVLAAAHVAVTLGFVFFLYQLLKAAERMVIPANWVENSPQLLGAILGIKDPISALPEVSEGIEKTVGAISRLVDSVKAK